ncbi:MAG: HIT family protein [Candidatus Moranbacteria bacterium]|nr:HIT family protein [Candidatus Moranbacteria bacterium]
MPETIFDKIISGEMKSWKVWEDEKHLAFLTPFPNTPGLTVLIPKENKGDYIFSLQEQEYSELLNATKKVAKILEKAFETPRIAMVLEGTGVAHVHVKLYPLHGKLVKKTEVWGSHTEFYPQYIGYITTTEGPKMNDAQLNKIQEKIVQAQQEE